MMNSGHVAPMPLWFLPLVDDFKLDPFGLHDSFEGSMATADVKFELLLKLWIAGALYCTGFVSLSLLLHKNK